MCIEDLTELREWMETVPLELENLTEEVNRAVNDYDLIEEFYYPLSQDDFNVRWDAVFWPGKLQKQLEATYESLVEIEEDLKKIQLKDANEFQDRLESIQMGVAGFASYADPSKAHEVANEVRRTIKSLAECQESANLYNNRERLFGLKPTDYSKIQKLQRDFTPYKDLWTAASDWTRWFDTWMNDSFNAIDPELLEKQVNDCFRTFHKSVKTFKDVPGVLDVASSYRNKVDDFKPYIPLIQGLRNPGMRIRHWDQLSADIGMNIKPKKDLTFQKCLDMNLQDYTEQINKISDVAAKEYSIEQALDKMESQWEPIEFEVMEYKDTGTYIIKAPEEASQLLDDHIVMTQSMSFSPFKKPFEERIVAWEATLRVTQDVLDEWMACQRSWLYLEPIFSSDDINRQLPVESKRYQTMDRTWRKIMKNTKDNPKVISICNDQRLCDKLKECNQLLEQVQKGLSEYLETKRMGFPRFFFLSDDELLEILSQTKDPTAVQPHLRKCFENIARITFGDDLSMSAMTSAEGETVSFCEIIFPRGNVENWLTDVERVMMASVKDFLKVAIAAYPDMQRTDWVLKWPGQVVIAGCQTYWAQEVEEAITAGQMVEYCDRVCEMLADLVALVRGKLSNLERMILSALIVIEVHARDVTLGLRDDKIKSINEFEWISQLRYYWTDGTFIRAVNAEFEYGYEYLGNSGRLVITPLTDRCYLTLTGALHLKFGGAPAGPAGTGKTETTKDLGKALAIQTVVFNCSDQLDFMAMGKFLKGLASTGAWACFDEFNRIDIEVLSVVAQQITTIQKAQMARVDTFAFEGAEIRLIPSCAVFITMNPGYAGRTELPDNLKALFRPVAMMVPNYAMIAEISLYSFGFNEAKVLAHKITATFTLSSEQLSSQDHYDFGMRAVKTVISAAGNLKREHPEMEEELICLRAIRDVNVPKFLLDDLKLFRGIVSDLFPGVKEDPVDYGSLLVAIENACQEKHLEAVEGFVNKCIQLYETTVVRHGLMLVGPTVSGKTACSNVLASALTSLKGQESISGGVYEAVHVYTLNPKSITMGQLYGEFDPMTHEWTDGILSCLIRQGCGADNEDKRWYMFDGPVDAVWIENMNTVLDDNKKLCLSSGEIIKLSAHMTMMFEVADLAVASPATVSRCGMVYLEPGYIGLDPFVNCWLEQCPPGVDRNMLRALFDLYLEPCIDWMRRNVKEIVGSVNGNLVFSLLNLMDTFIACLKPKDMGPIGSSTRVKSSTSMGRVSLTAGQRHRLSVLTEPWFIFSLIWSIGATTDDDGRIKFSNYLRGLMSSNGSSCQFPSDGDVYDYCLEDDTLGEKNDDEDEAEAEQWRPEWVNWLTKIDEYHVPDGANFTDILVPTIDTVRLSSVLARLVGGDKQVLAIGPTGTGKSVVVSDKLLTGMSDRFVPISVTFSAKTSANQTQDLMDSKLDKRRKGIFGPPISKYAVFFIDDFNMPALEEYGAQPPIELIRQWMDHGGWYDRKSIGTFRTLVDIGFVCAMGPPGGGRNPVTARLTRHFNYLSFVEMSDASKCRIFGTIMSSWLPENLLEHCDTLVNSTIAVYATVCAELLPTPAKSHYTFNLRDLAKVFQGILMHNAADMEDLETLIKLWYHEASRVFSDRLINLDDRGWFEAQLKEQITTKFDLNYDEMCPAEVKPVLFADYCNDARKYQLITSHEKMINVMTESLEDFNQISTAKMNLVLFMDAAEHVTRITRIIRQPLGNALLLGMGGSGRQSLTRLAAHLSDYECFQIELAKGYGVTEWREDIKKVMLSAGLKNNPIVFLFSDTQIKEESFLEDINNILNSGDVPNIYAQDELDKICTEMRTDVINAGLPATKSNLFSAYTKRVRQNLHTVVCMSPIGDVFRARLRQFPSLITCCTIDWFTEWPDEALRSVANTFIAETPVPPEVLKGVVDVCMEMHQSVSVASTRFAQELQRHNYVTPTAYLDLLALFTKLFDIKIDEVRNARDRMKVGLDKLLKTADDVAIMQVELEEMKPELEKAQVATAETMKQIEQDTIVANETKAEVTKQEADAQVVADKATQIAEDAQRDLDEALPALEAATSSLKSLNTNDVVEVRAMQRPPDGVRLVIEAVCIMFGIKPKRVAGEKPGQKIDDYWEPGKGLLKEPPKFLKSLFDFDKDNIPDNIIDKIQVYMDNEGFEPAAIAKSSKACTSICMWVRAMHKYHWVAKGVEPKRRALAEAQEELAATQVILDKARAKLAEVEAGLRALNDNLQKTVAKKEELERNTKQCEDRLVRADKLIGGLAGEKVRWAESIERLNHQLDHIAGDVLVSAGTIAYSGPFTGEFRADLVKTWTGFLDDHKVPRTDNPDLVSAYGNPVLVRNWQIYGLPRDGLSTENAVITQYTKRWPLFIDPQGQANKWIRQMEKAAGIEVLKLTDKDFLRSLENAVRFGKPVMLENVLEELDPALEPILLKQTFKQQGSTVIKLGDAVIPYHSDFKLYLTSKLPNPHYTPEISTKVTIINFTLAPSGLEDQLLGRVVAQERPDLEEAKNQLIVQNANMKKELKEIEDEILQRLSDSQGNPVDDVELISALEASNIKSTEIKAKVAAAEVTEKEIDETRMKYVPVAVRSQILFFCVSDLSSVDPMYQYSLDWYVNIFVNAIANAERADDIEQRIVNINNYMTFSLYCNVCRSLFERHKLMFAFLVCARIQLNDNLISPIEWRYLLAGSSTMPDAKGRERPEWLPERSWLELLQMDQGLDRFNGITDKFLESVAEWKLIYECPEPHQSKFPVSDDLNQGLARMILLRMLRIDKLTNSVQDYVGKSLGQRFIEPQSTDLAEVFDESSPTMPLIYVLSAGTDPALQLYKFAESRKFAKKLAAISLGQGQGPIAERMMMEAMDRGHWVFFQNCHLSPSWMPSLERLIENISPDFVHRDFRIWLTSMPSTAFPVSVLQNGSKMTMEPPKGIKANLLKSYGTMVQDDNFLQACSKPDVFKPLLFSLCLFHGVLLERKKFGSLGFNIPYDFTDGDLRICQSQLRMFLDEYDDAPYKVLTYTAGHINYGGRVTDDWDRRCMMSILAEYYREAVLAAGHVFDPSSIFVQPDPAETDFGEYMTYLKSLPINDNPDVFGLHNNADISYANNQSNFLLNTLLQLQPRTGGGGGSREDAVNDLAKDILANLPPLFNQEEIAKAYPVMYEESMNTVLQQEAQRFSRLLNVMSTSLNQILKAIKGLVVMSEPLEKMFNSLFDNQVPTMWSKVAYPSLKPLGSWVKDLIERCAFIQKWIDDGSPAVYWISGFFFPQAFITGTLQNYARKVQISIHTISFDFAVLPGELDAWEKITKKPEDGCYIRGLYLESAIWDTEKGVVSTRVTYFIQAQLLF